MERRVDWLTMVVDDLGHALEEPEPVFRLTFALQSAQDPSLTVDADAGGGGVKVKITQ